ncbi:DNRLRE domain-containing protein [Nonomuraea sp. GTA35]|uniref:DNRLRE domain-containing protein n=1 Tax=Nonomuraea sp. GTA35 TaxID=1676746 RepID=UPI0035BFCA26
MTIETWSQPVRVKQPAGTWAWIDPTLVARNGVLQPKIAKAGLEISAGGSGKPLATFSPHRDRSISLSWPQPLPAPVVTGNRATYRDAAGAGVDIVLTALATGYRQDIVFRERPSKPVKLALPVQGSGLRLEEQKDGRLRLVDAARHRVAGGFQADIIAAPSGSEEARASTGKPGRVKAEVEDTQGRQTLVITPEEKFLQDPATTYPVTLSSAFTMGLDADVDVANDGALADPTRPLLTAGSIFGILSRTYLRFNTTAITGQDVVDAKLSLLNNDGPGCGDIVGDGIQVRRVTSTWDKDDLTWDTTPSSTLDGAVTVREGYSAECGEGRLEWPITDIARSWANHSPNYGLELRTPDESSPDDNYRGFASSEYGIADATPKLTVTYQGFGGPTIVSPAGSDGVEVFTAPDRWQRDSLPIAEAQAHALDVADTRVSAHSSALATPLVDMVTGAVHIPAVTAEGQSLAAQAVAGTAYLSNGDSDWTVPGEFEGAAESDADGDGAPGVSESFSFNPTVQVVAQSAAKLDSIMDEVLGLDAVLPGGDKIMAAGLWPERNQVILQATEVSPELRLALAQRYGVTAVSIWLRPDAGRPITLVERTAAADTCPLDDKGKERECRLSDGVTGETIGELDLHINGGSRYRTTTGTCSTGFAWGTTSENYFITAGHCLPEGTTPSGAVRLTDNSGVLGDAAGSNYRTNVGTIPYPANAGKYGDLSRMKLTTRVHTASIFSGGPTSTTKREVVGKWTRSPRKGDRYCTGGYKKGELCGWVVQNARTYYEFVDTPGGPIAGRIENIFEGSKDGACSQPGDSGGPVYTIIQSGYPSAGDVMAKGIVSGGRDQENSNILLSCKNYSTNIWYAPAAFGGDIKKRKLD